MMSTLLLSANCEWCHDVLEGEEIEAPFDYDGETICEDCWDNYYFENSVECPICCNHYLEDDLSEYFVVFDPEVAVPGIYKPLRLPFYVEEMLGGGWMMEENISRVGFVPRGAEQGVCPCAHICERCIARRKQKWKWDDMT